MPFTVDVPADGRESVYEMNLRASRSSAPVRVHRFVLGDGAPRIETDLDSAHATPFVARASWSPPK
ncbi:MAG: hypothetical protein U0270_30210 [Labilithrix sp.]